MARTVIVHGVASLAGFTRVTHVGSFPTRRRSNDWARARRG
ncbi:hypothetical protein [Actinomyces mediterranea]|nr:hypothetical protein [Actinomyces mediterranea]